MAPSSRPKATSVALSASRAGRGSSRRPLFPPLPLYQYKQVSESKDRSPRVKRKTSAGLRPMSTSVRMRARLHRPTGLSGTDSQQPHLIRREAPRGERQEPWVHPKVVSELLGHSTVALTLDVYSHAIPAMEEDAAVRIAALVTG